MVLEKDHILETEKFIKYYFFSFVKKFTKYFVTYFVLFIRLYFAISPTFVVESPYLHLATRSIGPGSGSGEFRLADIQIGSGRVWIWFIRFQIELGL